MSDRQQVGQLFTGAVHVPANNPAEIETLRRLDIGSVILMGRSHVGVDGTRALTGRLQPLMQTAADGRIGLLVSADQEGGAVQVLNGPGFSRIPSGLVQGQWTGSMLRRQAAGWAEELHRAGVNLDLAPIADVVPTQIGTKNGPIGRYGRQFGDTPDAVARSEVAFVQGFAEGGVLTTLKHFPGLGRVSGNTDTTATVVDDALTRDGNDVTAFRSGIAAGAGFVMVSLATYPRIDPDHKAVFSPVIVDGMLRHDLGFRGVIVSDDLGNAASVQSVPPARRALRFLRAGGDLALTVNTAQLPAMTEAVLHEMEHDTAFRAKVRRSVRRILSAKQAVGAVRCSR
ncbi:glycoside hydrolase family 3 N-terminal domain-containing protein [Streptomyces sp. NPDC058086]|uniref:glycoside hydrolase family 3 N-terminal domain-containing protein n=1 Tax=Streptomyces sp. NPDC058086 TaxID=3346334 RepID=UPI0036EFB344